MTIVKASAYASKLGTVAFYLLIDFYFVNHNVTDDVEWSFK